MPTGGLRWHQPLEYPVGLCGARFAEKPPLALMLSVYPIFKYFDPRCECGQAVHDSPPNGPTERPRVPVKQERHALLMIIVLAQNLRFAAMRYAHATRTTFRRPEGRLGVQPLYIRSAMQR